MSDKRQSKSEPSQQTHKRQQKDVPWRDTLKLGARRSDELPPITEEPAASKFYEHVRENFDAPMVQKWRAVQSFILRGLYGGLVASLTLVGSQLFVGSVRENVAWLTLWFIVGLALQGVRMIMEAVGALLGVLGQYDRVKYQINGFYPGHGWTRWPLILDFLSFIILVANVGYGLSILFKQAS